MLVVCTSNVWVDRLNFTVLFLFITGFYPIWVHWYLPGSDLLRSKQCYRSYKYHQICERWCHSEIFIHCKSGHMCRSNLISNWWIGHEYLHDLWLILLCITAASHCIWHSLPLKQSHLWCNYLSGSRWVWTCLHTICHLRDHHSGNHQHWQSGDHCIGCGPRC